jgi:CRP-like cAMP-binding protein
MFSTTGRHDCLGNDLLKSLTPEELARLRPGVQLTTLLLGQVIYESGGYLDYVYFPTTCVVSCLYTMHDGSTAEMALAGNEGVIGIALLLGGSTTPHRAVVSIGGDAIKIPARMMQAEFARGGQLQHILLHYIQALITQISQTAVCNRLHSVEQRLCRWLLLCHDRVSLSEILMTQEYIANMLGGRRESVTVAAGHLQDLGLIHYSRGHITILDRKGLEMMVCECYRVVKDELDRLLRPPPVESKRASTWVRQVPMGLLLLCSVILPMDTAAEVQADTATIVAEDLSPAMPNVSGMTQSCG